VYKNIEVKGNVAKKIFNGELSVNDQNIDFDFLGKVDFTQKLPQLNFTMNLNKANLGALHFVDSTKRTNLSTQVVLDVTGNTIDNLIGEVRFDNTVYVQDREVYRVNLFNMRSNEQNGI